MEREIEELKQEIVVLTKKVEMLEKKENQRRIAFYLKLLFKIILIGLFAYGVWRGYEYVSKEIPNIMEEKIKELNPLKKFT